MTRPSAARRPRVVFMRQLNDLVGHDVIDEASRSLEDPPGEAEHALRAAAPSFGLVGHDDVPDGEPRRSTGPDTPPEIRSKKGLGRTLTDQTIESLHSGPPESGLESSWLGEPVERTVPPSRQMSRASMCDAENTDARASRTHGDHLQGYDRLCRGSLDPPGARLRR